MFLTKRFVWLDIFTTLISLCSSSSTINQKTPQYQLLPTLREQAQLQQTWHDTRLAHIPTILKRNNAEVYLITQLEHGEDTVFWSLKSPLAFAARRRTVQLFIANPKHGLKESYTWIDNTPAVWFELNDVLEKQDPGMIVVNAGNIAFSGGLRVGEMEQMNTWLPKKWTQMFVNVPMIGLEIVATMPKDQLGWYKLMMETAWAMITDGFSERVVVPGETSTADVEWWLRSKIQAYNYTTWFHPDVEIVGAHGESDFLLEEPNIINYGDMLHVDFGVTALGMNTDTQHLAYVLHPGETEKDIPQGLKEGLKKANRMQDILKSNMKIGMSGNEILEKSLKQMDKEGIVGKIYSHPIGDWGHSAGTLIGMYPFNVSILFND